jgi:hypothetical protein
VEPEAKSQNCNNHSAALADDERYANTLGRSGCPTERRGAGGAAAVRHTAGSMTPSIPSNLWPQGFSAVNHRLSAQVIILVKFDNKN